MIEPVDDAAALTEGDLNALKAAATTLGADDDMFHAALKDGCQYGIHTIVSNLNYLAGGFNRRSDGSVRVDRFEAEALDFSDKVPIEVDLPQIFKNHIDWDYHELLMLVLKLTDEEMFSALFDNPKLMHYALWRKNPPTADVVMLLQDSLCRSDAPQLEEIPRCLWNDEMAAAYIKSVTYTGVEVANVEALESALDVIRQKRPSAITSPFVMGICSGVLDGAYRSLSEKMQNHWHDACRYGVARRRQCIARWNVWWPNFRRAFIHASRTCGVMSQIAENMPTKLSETYLPFGA